MHGVGAKKPSQAVMVKFVALLLCIGVASAAISPYHGPEGLCGTVGVCGGSPLASGCVQCMEAVGEVAQRYQTFSAYAELGLSPRSDTTRGVLEGLGSELRAQITAAAEELLVNGAVAQGPGHEVGSYGPFSVPAYAVCAKAGVCTDGNAFCPSQPRAREDASSLAPLFAARNDKAAGLISVADDELSSDFSPESTSVAGQLSEAVDRVRNEVMECVREVTDVRGKVDEVNSALKALEVRARDVATTPRLKELLRGVNALREELETKRAHALAMALGPHPDHPECLCPAAAALGSGSDGSLDRDGVSGGLPENPRSTTFAVDKVPLTVPTEPAEDCYPENAVCGCCGSLHFSPLVSYDRRLRHLEVRLDGEVRKLRQCRAAKAASKMVLADASAEKDRFSAEVDALGEDVETMITTYENQLQDLETVKSRNLFSVSAMTGSIYGKMDECLSNVAMCNDDDDDDGAEGDDEEGGDETLLQVAASTQQTSSAAVMQNMRASTRNMSVRRCKTCEEYMCHYTMFMMYTNMDSIRKSLWASFNKNKRKYDSLLKGNADAKQTRADMKWRQLEFNKLFKEYKCPLTDNPTDCDTWTESLTRLTLAGDYIIEKYLAGCMDEGKQYGPYQCPFYSMCRRAYLDTSNGSKGQHLNKAAYCTKENLPPETNCPEGEVSSQTYTTGKRYYLVGKGYVKEKVMVKAKAARTKMKKKGKRRFVVFERNREKVAKIIEQNRSSIADLQEEIPKLEAQLEQERSAIDDLKGSIASDRELTKARTELDSQSQQVLEAAAEYDLIQKQIHAARGWSGCIEERKIGDVDCLCLKVDEGADDGENGEIGHRMINGPSWQRGTGLQLGGGGPGGNAVIDRLAREVEKQSNVVPSLPADKLRKYKDLLEKPPASEDDNREDSELSDSELDKPPMDKIFRLIGDACTAQIEEQWCGPHQTLNPLGKGTGDPSVMLLRSQNRLADDLNNHKKGLEDYRRSLQSQLAALARAQQQLEDVMSSEKSSALQALHKERDQQEYKHTLLRDAIARARAQLVTEMGKKKAKENAAFSEVKECYDRLKAGALPEVSAS